MTLSQGFHSQSLSDVPFEIIMQNQLTSISTDFFLFSDICAGLFLSQLVKVYFVDKFGDGRVLENHRNVRLEF